MGIASLALADGQGTIRLDDMGSGWLIAVDHDDESGRVELAIDRDARAWLIEQLTKMQLGEVL